MMRVKRGLLIILIQRISEASSRLQSEGDKTSLDGNSHGHGHRMMVQEPTTPISQPRHIHMAGFRLHTLASNLSFHPDSPWETLSRSHRPDPDHLLSPLDLLFLSDLLSTWNPLFPIDLLPQDLHLPSPPLLSFLSSPSRSYTSASTPSSLSTAPSPPYPPRGIYLECPFHPLGFVPVGVYGVVWIYLNGMHRASWAWRWGWVVAGSWV